MITTISAIRGLSGTLPSNYFYTTDRYQEGHWYYDATDTSSDDNTGTVLLTSDNKRIKRAFTSEINAKWFGAIGNGVADDTAALKRFVSCILKGVITNPLQGDRVSTIYGYLPAGTYLITEKEVLIPSTDVTKAMGYVLKGDGPGLTQITFNPTYAVTDTVSKYLVWNQAYMEIQIEGITFNSKNPLNSFWYSFVHASGLTPQRINFTFCKWTGDWNDGFFLEGDNNNSEWAFTDCGVKDTIGCFMRIPADNSSDNFLNFWFTRMKFWPIGTTGSNFIDFSLGGSITIADSDFSRIKSGTLFNLKGNVHAHGVQRFECRGSRFELLNEQCRVLYSEWSSGTVLFSGCDFGSQSNVYPPTSTLMEINYKGVVNGPAYMFQNCVLIGMINIHADSPDKYRLRDSIRFDSCTFLQVRFLENAFTFGNPATNSRGRVPVKLSNCIPGQSTLSGWLTWQAGHPYLADDVIRVRSVGTIFDKGYICTTAGTSDSVPPNFTLSDGIIDGTTVWRFVGLDTRNMPTSFTLNWTNCSGAVVNKHILAITGPSFNIGNFNSATGVMLPPEAIITSVRFFSPQNAVSENNGASFKVKTSENTPMEFLNFTIPNYSTGDFKEWNGFFNCGTDYYKRLIIVEPQSDVSQFNNTGQVLIEYIC